MERFNNQYVRAGLIGLLLFAMARIILAIVQGMIDWQIPLPNVLALIPAGWVAYWVLGHYHYE